MPELTIYWQENYYSASEADGSVEVCAELSTLQFTGSVEVNYATIADSAKGLSTINAEVNNTPQNLPLNTLQLILKRSCPWNVDGFFCHIALHNYKTLLCFFLPLKRASLVLPKCSAIY